MSLNYDDMTDDRAILQAMLDATPPGGTLELDANRVCKIVIDNTVPQRGLILPPKVKLKLNGTMLDMQFHTNVYGVRLQSYSQITDGRVYGTVSDTLSSSQGIYHSLITGGDGYGEITDKNAIGPYSLAEGWGIHNLELYNTKPNGLHISGVGGMNNGHISDILGPSNANAFGLINFDWGTVGPGGTIAQNRANFNNSNGSFYTIHPHNIKIERVRAKNFSNPISEIVRLSGASAIDVSNLTIDYAGTSGWSHYGGDFGYEFSLYNAERGQAFMNTVLRNMTLYGTGGNAVRFDAYADNIAREVGYVPITNPIYPSNLLIDGVAASAGVSCLTAINVGAIAGGFISRFRGGYFHTQGNFASGVSRLQWRDSVMHGDNASYVALAGAGAGGVSMNNVIFES